LLFHYTQLLSDIQYIFCRIAMIILYKKESCPYNFILLQKHYGVISCNRNKKSHNRFHIHLLRLSLLQSYIPAVQPFFTVLIKWQPVQYFLNITVPEIPLMCSRTFLVSYIHTQFLHGISELTVRRKKRII